MKQLQDESRAGATDPAIPTQWICLDIDGLPGVDDVEDLLRAIPGLQDASYIYQASASQGIEPGKGLSAHVFFLMESQVQPSVLKNWLVHLNLTIPVLRDNLKLARSGVVLKWPLDVTTCQNDKLLYIAPPTHAEGVVDSYNGPRIKLVDKGKTFCKPELFDVNLERNEQEKHKALNKLRVKAGLPKRQKPTERTVGDLPVMTNPGTAQVSGVKNERGFVYLNLNGGDSWGYYHPENNPEILMNFKGEPNYFIKELLPEYYEQITKKEPERRQGNGRHYLAILDKRTEQYARGYYDHETNELDLRPTNELRKVKDFLKQHGQHVPEFIEEWNVTYDFESDEIFDADKRWINLYRRNKYLRNPNRDCHTIPPIINKIISHVLAYDEPSIARFLNWLAIIIQERKQTGTAWILHGTQGTGKGLLFNYIIKPLIGEEYTSRCHLTAFQDAYNTFLESSLVVFVDEVQITELTKSSVAMSRIKQYIVEPEVAIRRMYCNPYITRNRCNFIFASNKHDSIQVDPDDRRFNVPLRQTNPIKPGYISTEEIKKIGTELQDFAGFLLNFKADRDLAGTPIQTTERTRLQELTRDTGEKVADSFLKGDLQFFIDNMPDGAQDMMRLEQELDIPNPPTYKEIINEWIHTEGMCSIPRIQMQVIFYYLAEIKHRSPNKFTRYVGHKGLEISQVWYDGKNVRGLANVSWNVTDEMKKEWSLIYKGKKPKLKAVD
ncbi:MAG: hypothetical protein GTN99_02850 [Candidatus Dadabacteria bacterium]|nr:hypothetical protein [Candidatus Dadabacteria bacterium]